MATPFLLRDSCHSRRYNGHLSSTYPFQSILVLWFLECLHSLLPSRLTTSNLPWFMDLTFLVPMQYCSLQHRTLFLPPVTSTAGCCFCFGSIPFFFLELFLHWSPVAYWTPTDLGSSSFSILLFCLFILFMGFSRQKYWIGLPFLSPVGHILSDLWSWCDCLLPLNHKQHREFWSILRVLISIECGPVEKGMASHFSIFALRTPWTVWKGKMIGYWKRNSPGQ